jgi:hypothetical protein
LLIASGVCELDPATAVCQTRDSATALTAALSTALSAGSVHSAGRRAAVYGAGDGLCRVFDLPSGTLLLTRPAAEACLTRSRLLLTPPRAGTQFVADVHVLDFQQCE